MWRTVVGIDEAGRGPIAGPVTVSAVAFLQPFDTYRLEGVKDSKQLSEKKREHFRTLILELEREGAVRVAIHSTPASVIDSQGIVCAIKSSLAIVLQMLGLPPNECFIKLDGSLKAPDDYIHQKTIIRGDETELPITLAGIMAKTARDSEMRAFARKYPEYGFDVHKGYGTKKHYEAIETFGLCGLHRVSFID